jgi:hypothetical protein
VKSCVQVGLLVLAVVALGVPAPIDAQGRTAEVVTLAVEVISRDPRPVIPCGHVGLQPRDVEALVRAVDGVPTAGRAHLVWGMCEFSRVDPGRRFRVRIRRRAGDPDGLTRTYHVL